MKLTPFGETVRILRMRFDLSLKAMADFMGLSSSHLSGIEYGEKRLLQKHVETALRYFADKASTKEIEELRHAAECSKEIVNTRELSSDARGLVAAFARRLQQGDSPPTEIMNWLDPKKKERDQ